MNRSKTTTPDRADVAPHETIYDLLRRTEDAIEEVNISIWFREMARLECKRGSYPDMVLSWAADRDLQQAIVLLQGFLISLEQAAKQQINGLNAKYRQRLKAVKTKATRILRNACSGDVSLAYFRSIWWL